jgi:histidyl-tRNA synthetase
MSKLDTAPYKGVRDFYPEDQFVENYIFKVWKRTAEMFGFEEYNASILEPADIYRQKTGDEIVNEQMYVFRDKGDREVALRPEMTPTVARMIAARRRELGFPLRWYSIPNLFRYEATQRGRLREHWQLNADTFGIKSLNADVEIITLANTLMKNFGATPDMYEIRLNIHGAGTKEMLDEAMAALTSAGITNLRYDESLERGQAYYNGIVFEFFDTNPLNNRSILGGGRYDNLSALFGDQDLPAVGFGAGDVTMQDFLETHGLLPGYKPSTDLAICLTDLKLADSAMDFAGKLRDEGINVAIDYTERKIGDEIKAADKLKIPYVLVYGENEASSGAYSVKHLASGTEVEGGIKEIISTIKG